MQSRRDGAERARHGHRRFDAESGDRRIHLREGPPLSGTGLRRRPPAVSGCPQGTQGPRQLPAGDLGRRDRADCGTTARCPRPLGRRVHPAVFVRRLERAADPGHERRHAVSAAGGVASGADGLRSADGRREQRPLRQDAVRRLRGLPRGASDRHLGRESVRVGHPPGSIHPRGAAARREAGGGRSPDDPARETGGSAPCRPSRYRPAGRPRRAPSSVRDRRRRSSVCRGAHAGSGAPPREGTVLDHRAGGRRSRHPARYPARVRGAVRRHESGAAAMRLGTGAEPQRWQRQPGDPGAPGGRWQVRRPRRRLHDEQLGVVGHRAHVDRGTGTGDAARQHEPSRPRAHRVRGSAGAGAVRLQLERRWRPRPTSGASCGDWSATTCSPSSSTR